MFKKLFWVLLIITGLSGTVQAGVKETKIRVLALSATSSQDPAFDLTSLLDHSAKQGWKPGIAGTGAEEGIWIRFENPIKMDAVQLSAKGTFIVSMNGQDIGETNGYFYVPGKIKVQTLFICVAFQPEEPAELTGIKLCRGGVALPVEKPVLVPGSVQATGVLSPEPAYGPFRLFDSRPDLAFALDGSKIDPKKPVHLFDLTLKKAAKLKGFFIWNGYQRSDDLYAANSRPKVITVHNGTSVAKFTLKDKTGPQWFAFPEGGWNTSSLSFDAEEVIPGKAYKDLVISEICFVTHQDEILLVKVPAPTLKGLDGIPKVVDQSLVSFPAGNAGEYSLKFRSDGTFAAFQQTLLAKEVGPQYSRKIWEGNWVPMGPDKIKVFGKAYSNEPVSDGTAYGVAVAKPSVKTFQTTLQVTDLSHPSAVEKDRIFNFLSQSNPGAADTANADVFWKDLSHHPGAVFVESNLFSQVMVLDEFKK